MTKRIAAGIALGLLWVAACACVFLPGCATVSGAMGSSSDTVIRIATYAYIRQAGVPQAQVRRAERIRAVVAELERTAAGEPLTLERFTQLALERLPPDITPADRLLAVEFVGLLGGELQKSIGLGGLQSDSLVRLPAALRAVDQAASFFAPRGS